MPHRKQPCSRTSSIQTVIRESDVNRLIRSSTAALVRAALGFFMFAATAAANPSTDCELDAVHEHVREQFANFGPLSSRREYFGFIYLFDGRIASAVVRGSECRNGDRCTVNTAGAARAIPKGARLLG